MTKMITYDDMTIEMMQGTQYPAEMLGLALSITMKSSPDDFIPKFTAEKGRFILEAEHSSVFEHVVYTFLIQNMSRSLLAQLTRQRTASPTSGSQHYQTYTDYPCSVSPCLTEEQATIMQDGIDYSFETYDKLLKTGLAKEEARQALPNAAVTNYLWTIDARNLALFLRLRLCHRNVLEMQIFAEAVLSMVIEHFPELYRNVGPQCFRGKCKQGPMKCVEGPWIPRNA